MKVALFHQNTETETERQEERENMEEKIWKISQTGRGTVSDRVQLTDINKNNVWLKLSKHLFQLAFS